MIGLICIGLLGLVAAIFFVQNRQAEEVAAIPTPTVFIPANTPTPSSTPTSVPHTPTSLPTPTGTPVISNNGEAAVAPEAQQSPTETVTVDPNVTPTLTLVVATDNAELTPTSTLVVQVPTVAPTPTASAIPPAAEMPQGGEVLPANSYGFLIWAGMALLGLLLAFGMINHFKSSS